MKKAVFLDRDGVVNIERGEYTYSWEDFSFVPGLFDFCRDALEKNYLIFIISNQGGIAKGIYSVNDVQKLHQKVQHAFLAEKIKLTDIYICPHHQDFGKCICRKPDSLMLEKALAKYNVDAGESIFIGDSERDIIAAKKVGVKGILIKANSNLIELLKFLR